jgi:hypothetical protein
LQLADISGKKEEILKDNIYQLATKSKNKNNRDLCRAANEFKRATKLEITQ